MLLVIIGLCSCDDTYRLRMISNNQVVISTQFKTGYTVGDTVIIAHYSNKWEVINDPTSFRDTTYAVEYMESDSTLRTFYVMRRRAIIESIK